ncbi:MAG: hypothetical protein HFF92_05285 [Oscillibacter sp.]|nr:hypothetical protein [Oscillibacter sp.]
MISRNSSRFVFFFRLLYSISLKLSCFIPRAPFPLFYHIFYHFGELNQRFLNTVHQDEQAILDRLSKSSVTEQAAASKRAGQEKRRAEKRLNELDNLHAKIYEDRLNAKINERNFSMLSQKYQQEDRRYVTKAAYMVLGITMDGTKDIPGLWSGEHEGSEFWLNVLNDRKSRGAQDVYLFCTDGLCGMMQAIQAVYPQSRLQRCIVHQIRASPALPAGRISKK